MNTLNKLLIGASMIGSIYLTGCNDVDNRTVANNALIQVQKNADQTTAAVSIGDIVLEPNTVTWNNAKLISKDEGFIDYLRHPGWDSSTGHAYSYAKCLFKGPNDTEISLFSKDGTFYVGQNYNIAFHLLKPNQKISSGSIMEALEGKGDYQVLYNKNVDDLNGLLDSYLRVQKSIENSQ